MYRKTIASRTYSPVLAEWPKYLMLKLLSVFTKHFSVSSEIKPTAASVPEKKPEISVFARDSISSICLRNTDAERYIQEVASQKKRLGRELTQNEEDEIFDEILASGWNKPK